MRLLFPILVCFLCVSWATDPLKASDLAAPRSSYVTELAERARALRLAEDRQWRALVHYAPNLFSGGVTGLVDNPRFYYASDGKTDPQAELIATLEAFSRPLLEADGNDHPQCRMVARYRWLKSKLRFDPARLPEYRCEAFEAWYREINPGQVTFIFPAAYLNNPSSMFGHTLIRIDPPEQEKTARLTSYTIHFAADHQGEQGAIFALKGLAGGYRGYFSLLPYYEKVTQYSDIENRDIWEYALNLKPGEIEIMLQNLWELEQQPIDYYFFTTNCSFVLVSLLNVARPDLDLTQQFPLYAVPVDTVRALLDDEEMLAGAVFRPSARTKIQDLQASLTPEQQRLALRLAKGRVEPDAEAITHLEPGVRARTLELAQSYLQYLLDTGKIEREVMAPRSLALLSARAKVRTPPQPQTDALADAAIAAKLPARPDQGHLTQRLAGGIGMTGETPFSELRARAVYHDLLDPPQGYVPGAAIELGEIRLRHMAGKTPTLESLTAVAITSIAARDEIFQPLSWRTRIALDRWREDGDDVGELVLSASGGAGAAWTIADAVLISPMLESALYADADSPDRRLFGIGPNLEAVWPVTPWWTVRMQAGQQFVFGIDDQSIAFNAVFGQGFHFTRNLSLRVDVGARNDGDETFGLWSAMLNWYF